MDKKLYKERILRKKKVNKWQHLKLNYTMSA